MLPPDPVSTLPARTSPPSEAPRSAGGWLWEGADRLLRFGWPLLVLNVLGAAASAFAFGAGLAPWTITSLMNDGVDATNEAYGLLAWLAVLPVLTVWFAFACRMSLEAASGVRPAVPMRFPPAQTLLSVAGVIAMTNAPWFLLDGWRAVFGPTVVQRLADGTPDLVALGVNVAGAVLLGSGMALAPWFAADRGMRPVAALIAGWQAFSGRRWTLFIVVVTIRLLTLSVWRFVGPFAAPVLSALSDTVLALVYLHTARSTHTD